MKNTMYHRKYTLNETPSLFLFLLLGVLKSVFSLFVFFKLLSRTPFIILVILFSVDNGYLSAMVTVILGLLLSPCQRTSWPRKLFSQRQLQRVFSMTIFGFRFLNVQIIVNSPECRGYGH